MLAGTGAGLATGFRHAMLKLAALFAGALIAALMAAAAIGTFGFAIYFALTPALGPAWSATAAGLLLIVAAAVLALICRFSYRRRPADPRGPARDPLRGPLGAAALGASMGAGPGFDIKGTLERNAVTVLLAAFIAGMVMNNRK
jgi:hypothetical protein